MRVYLSIWMEWQLVDRRDIMLFVIRVRAFVFLIRSLLPLGMPRKSTRAWKKFLFLILMFIMAMARRIFFSKTTRKLSKLIFFNFFSIFFLTNFHISHTKTLTTASKSYKTKNFHIFKEFYSYHCIDTTVGNSIQQIPILISIVLARV